MHELAVKYVEITLISHCGGGFVLLYKPNISRCAKESRPLLGGKKRPALATGEMSGGSGVPNVYSAALRKDRAPSMLSKPSDAATAGYVIRPPFTFSPAAK